MIYQIKGPLIFFQDSQKYHAFSPLDTDPKYPVHNHPTLKTLLIAAHMRRYLKEDSILSNESENVTDCISKGHAKI
jgi:hypothetical protein